MNIAVLKNKTNNRHTIGLAYTEARELVLLCTALAQLQLQHSFIPEKERAASFSPGRIYSTNIYISRADEQ